MNFTKFLRTCFHNTSTASGAVSMLLMAVAFTWQVRENYILPKFTTRDHTQHDT